MKARGPAKLLLLDGEIVRPKSVRRVPHYVYLTDKQREWIGRRPPLDKTCTGCILFGSCAKHGTGLGDAEASSNTRS